jgi:hypothetical protein
MEIEKPKIKDISLKDVAWGTPEFYEMIKQAKEQQAKQKEYERTIEAIRTIQGDY